MVRAYQPSDLATLNRWYVARGLAPVTADLLPPTGYLVEDVAAGFYLRTDAPGIGFLDGFVTCPTAPLRARREAVVAIAERIVAQAEDEGVTRLCGFTRSRGMCRLVEELGFSPIEGDFLALKVR